MEHRAWGDGPPPIGKPSHWVSQGNFWVHQGPLTMWVTKGDWRITTFDRFFGIEDIEEEEPVLYDPLDPVDNAPDRIRHDRLGTTE